MNGYDAVIVGAGPSGAAAAFFTKFFDSSKKVLLIDRLNEKQYNIYHRICGEAISSKIIEEMKPLSIDGIIEKINYIKDTWCGKIDIKETSEGFIVNRPVMLNSIIEQFKRIGGEINHDNFLGLEVKNKIFLKTDKGIFQTKYLIGADGANSVVRKCAGISNPNIQCLAQYVIDKIPEKGVLNFYYDEKYNGVYKWVFPNGNTTKIGFPVGLKNKEKINERIIQKQSRCVAFGGIKYIVSGNILLIGDAAGQTNAFSKGGIRPGMNAGKWAGEAVAKDKPAIYRKKWFSSGFSSKLPNYLFEKFRKMENKEILYHLKPFLKYKGVLSYITALFFYSKYMKLYYAYDIIDKYGW